MEVPVTDASVPVVAANASPPFAGGGNWAAWHTAHLTMKKPSGVWKATNGRRYFTCADAWHSAQRIWLSLRMRFLRGVVALAVRLRGIGVIESISCEEGPEGLARQRRAPRMPALRRMFPTCGIPGRSSIHTHRHLAWDQVGWASIQAAMTSPWQGLGLQKHPSRIPRRARTRARKVESFSMRGRKYESLNRSMALAPCRATVKGLPKYPSSPRPARPM